MDLPPAPGAAWQFTIRIRQVNNSQALVHTEAIRPDITM
jgi:hypothetical protein